MKTTSNFIRYIVLLLVLLIGCSLNAQSEDKVHLSMGYGIPEMVNIGVGYDIDPVVLGFSVGGAENSGEYLISYVIDIRYHFAGSSYHTYRRPWFGDVGFNYVERYLNNKIDINWYLKTRVGREFNLHEKYGVYFSLGVIYRLYRKDFSSDPRIESKWIFDIPYFNPKVIPSLGIGVFYKI